MQRRSFWLALAPVTALVLSAPAPAAMAQEQDVYEWVALGDSYTAGIFTGQRAEPLDGCERTPNSYPDVVNDGLTEFPPGLPVVLTNVSCGNATILEVSRESQTPIGWGPTDPALPPDGWPAVPPQTERAAVGESTDVITIGIGGNSLPLGELIQTCLALGAEDPAGNPCRTYYENPPAGVENIEDRLVRIQDEYVQMLLDVHGQAPNARVITVGYPQLLPANAAECAFGDPSESFTLAGGDIPWLRDVEERLNTAIQNVTTFFGDRYVDTYVASEGRDMCQPAETKWLEGFCGTPDPASDLPAGLCPLLGSPLRQTLFHPNNDGHFAMAQPVERAIRLALLEL